MDIRTFIKQQGLTEKLFAEKVGISQGYVSHILNGRRVPSPEVALQIERVTSGEIKAADLVFSPRIKKTKAA